MAKGIKVTVVGGVVQDIENMPLGIEVVVTDYDTDGTDQNLRVDGNGDRFAEALYESRMKPTEKSAQSERGSDLMEPLRVFAPALNLTSENLDESVHEIKSQQAADINNTGLEGQLQFLLDSIEDDENLMTWLRDRF